MSWPNNLRKLKNMFTTLITTVTTSATNLFNTILFLIHTMLYDINKFLFNSSIFICHYAHVAAIFTTIILISFELYVVAHTITAMTLFTTLLIVIPIFLITAPIIFFTSDAMQVHYEAKYITKINSSQVGLNHNYFMKILYILIILATFMLIIAPYFVSCILPVIAFILKDVVFVLTNITSCFFSLGCFFLSVARSIGESKSISSKPDYALLLVLSLAAIFYILGSATYTLATIISYFGHAKITIYLTNLIAITPVIYGMFQAYSSTEEQSPTTSNTTVNIRYHLMLQLGLLVRSVLTITISGVAFNFAGPTLMALIAPYATYILVVTGIKPLTMRIYHYTGDILKAVCAAIIYAIATCYLITQHSVAFILVPHMIGLALAIGAGVIGTQLIFYATSYVANQIIDKVFKPGSAVIAMRLKYREFISHLKLPEAVPIASTTATKETTQLLAPTAFVEAAPIAVVCAAV